MLPRAAAKYGGPLRTPSDIPKSASPAAPSNLSLSTSLWELVTLAVPSSLFVLLTNGYRVVDQYWVDRISVDAQAAVGATMFVVVMAYATFELLSAGAGPLVARATGADDPEIRKTILGQSLFGGIVLAAGWTVLGTLAAEPIAASLGLEDAAREEASAYLRALALTCLPLVLTPLLDQAFLALGDAKTPLGLHALAVAANLVLTPLFVVGLDAGVAGAALASNISRGLATSWGVVNLARRTGVSAANIRPGPQLARVIRIGTPMALSTALYGGVYWVMLSVAVSPLGPAVNAALGIGWSALEGLSWPIFHGVALAAASIVGRRIGARDPRGAYRAALFGLIPTTLLGAAATVLFTGFGETLTAPFASDPEVHRQAVRYALIVGASQLFVALETTAEGVLAGAADTRAVLWTSAPLNLLRAPLAWLAALHLGWGADGIWWVITLTTMVKAALKLTLVIRGRWTQLVLDDDSHIERRDLTDVS